MSFMVYSCAYLQQEKKNLSPIPNIPGFFFPCALRQAGTCCVLLFYNRSYVQQLKLEGTEETFWGFDILGG